MGAAPEICDSSSLDKYNLIGGAQKRGSVRGLSQAGGDRACWHFLLCLCLIAKLCQVWFSVGTNAGSFCFMWPQLGTLLKLKLNCIPFPTSPLSSPTQVNIDGCICGLCALHTLKMHNNLITALTVGKTSLKRMLSSSPAPCNPSPQKNPPKTPKWQKKIPNQQNIQMPKAKIVK